MRTQNELYWAIATGDSQRLTGALKYGDVIEVRSPEAIDPLFFTVELGNLPVFRLLLSAGVNPKQRDKHGRTLVHAAASWNRIEILDVLQGFDLNLNARANDLNKCAPIHEAAQRGAFEAVRWLVMHGADATLRLANGKTAAEIARARGHQKVVDLLSRFDPTHP